MIAGIAVDARRTAAGRSASPAVPPAAIRGADVSSAPVRKRVDVQHVQDAGDRQRSRRRRRRSAGAVAPGRVRCASARRRRPPGRSGRRRPGRRSRPGPRRRRRRRPGRRPAATCRSHRPRPGRSGRTRCRPGGARASMSRVGGGTAADRPDQRCRASARPAATAASGPRPMPLIAVTIGDGLVRRLAGRAGCGRLLAAFAILTGRTRASSTPSTGYPPTRPTGVPIRAPRVAGADPERAGPTPGSGVGTRGSGGLSRHGPRYPLPVTGTPSATPFPGTVPSGQPRARPAVRRVLGLLLAGVSLRQTQLAGTCRS